MTDNRDWKMFRGRRGALRWYQRAYEAFLVVMGGHSLHRAWQLGLDQGASDEYRRLITNGAAAFELKCTCSPDDNPPRPCARKFAYSDCIAAALPTPPQEREETSK